MAEQENNPPIYFGSGKTVGDGKLTSLNICLSDIPKEFVSEFQGKQWVRATLGELKEPKYFEGKLKKTHWLAIDQWKPKED